MPNTANGEPRIEEMSRERRMHKLKAELHHKLLTTALPMNPHGG